MSGTHFRTLSLLIAATGVAAVAIPDVTAYPICDGIDHLTDGTVFSHWHSSSPHAADAMILGAVPTNCTGVSSTCTGFEWHYKTAETTSLAVLCNKAQHRCCFDTLGKIRFTAEPVTNDPDAPRPVLDGAVWTRCSPA